MTLLMDILAAVILCVMIILGFDNKASNFEMAVVALLTMIFVVINKKE